jgi:hypothetical protein
VPRLSLLSRFVSVSREGEFDVLGDLRMVYQIMVITRMMIIMGCSLVLFQAVNIAVKYSAVRR